MPDQTLNVLDIVGGPGGVAYALRPATCVLAKSLGVATAEDVTVPTGAKFCLFSATGDFYANYTTTATVPGDTAISAATASELNPGMRFISGVTTISIISSAAQVVTLSFWRD